MRARDGHKDTSEMKTSENLLRNCLLSLYFIHLASRKGSLKMTYRNYTHKAPTHLHHLQEELLKKKFEAFNDAVAVLYTALRSCRLNAMPASR